MKNRAEEFLRKNLADNGTEYLEHQYPKLFKGITEVMQEYADQQQDGWISVKERSPEIGNSVLVYPPMDCLPFGTNKGDEFGDERDKNFWQWDTNLDDAKIVKHITHWQPLPKAPQQ